MTASELLERAVLLCGQVMTLHELSYALGQAHGKEINGIDTATMTAARNVIDTAGKLQTDILRHLELATAPTLRFPLDSDSVIGITTGDAQ